MPAYHGGLPIRQDQTMRCRLAHCLACRWVNIIIAPVGPSGFCGWYLVFALVEVLLPHHVKKAVTLFPVALL